MKYSEYCDLIHDVAVFQRTRGAVEFDKDGYIHLLEYSINANLCGSYEELVKSDKFFYATQVVFKSEWLNGDCLSCVEKLIYRATEEYLSGLIKQCEEELNA